MATSTIKAPFVTESFTISNISSNTYYANGTYDISKNGYTPMGIIQYEINQAAVQIRKLTISGNTLEYGVSRGAIGTGTIADCQLKVVVMYR